MDHINLLCAPVARLAASGLRIDACRDKDTTNIQSGNHRKTSAFDNKDRRRHSCRAGRDHKTERNIMDVPSAVQLVDDSRHNTLAAPGSGEDPALPDERHTGDGSIEPANISDVLHVGC